MNIFDDYGNFIEEYEDLINKLRNSDSLIVTTFIDVLKVLDYVYEQYLAGDKIEEELIDIFDIGFGYFSTTIMNVHTYYKDYFGYLCYVKTLVDIGSFEDALSRLENIVRELEGGRIKLDDAVSAYEQAVSLKQLCEKKLENARLKIEKIEINNGNMSTSEFNIPEA